MERLTRRALPLAAALLLGACAQPPLRPVAPGQQRSHWTGRLALRIDSDPPQSMSAGFDLQGNADRGELSLSTPLGSTLARLLWAPGDARLLWNGQQRRFESMDALTREATGTELPIAGLFQWLAGEPAQVPGWLADLQEIADGKLVAHRRTPAPPVELRLVFE